MSFRLDASGVHGVGGNVLSAVGFPNFAHALGLTNTEDAFSGQTYFPAGLARRSFYRPNDRGFERELARRLNHWARLRERRDRDVATKDRPA